MTSRVGHTTNQSFGMHLRHVHVPASSPCLPPLLGPSFLLPKEEFDFDLGLRDIVTTPLWPSVGVKPNTWKSWRLESSGTLECLEVDNKGQNTSHWSVLGVIGKVLKRKYRKWPCIGNSNICNPSYGQKKGRESNWQFDSRPLKVGNRPLNDVALKSATWR
jgi:hypothetical protein